MIRSRVSAYAVAGLALSFAAGCASAPPPRSAVVVAAPLEVEKVDPGPTYMESEIGGLNEEAMDLAFASLERPLMRCLEGGSERVEGLGGHFKLSLRVDKGGSTRWVYLSESTLGDRDTEKCVLDLARTKSWPRPLGGEGLAEKSFDIDARSEPVSWEARRAQRALNHVHGEVARCRKGIPGSFVATVYVSPDGRVLTAGLATPSERGEEAADCVVEAVRRMRFGSHGDKAAKVSFALPET
jgi:hypothetical protein